MKKINSKKITDQLLMKRDYPLIVFLSLPQNHLDLFGFVLCLVYVVLKVIFHFYKTDFAVAIIYALMAEFFLKYNDKNQYKECIGRSVVFMVFFLITYLKQLG